MQDVVAKKLPRVAVLYADNYHGHAYFPKMAQAALEGKAEAEFIPLHDYDAGTVALKIYELQHGANHPDYIAVDVLNNTGQNDLADLAYHVRALNPKRSCNVVFGTVKNQAADDTDFYPHHRIPIVKWQNLQQAQSLNGDEIIRQQPQAKKNDNVIGVVIGFIFRHGLDL